MGVEGTNTDHFSHHGNHRHYRPQRGGHWGLATEKKITAKSYCQLDICTLHTLTLKNIILKCNIHKGCVQGQLPCVTFPNLLHSPLPQRQALVLRIYLEVVAGECSYSCTLTKGQSSSTDKITEGLPLGEMQSAVREEGSRLAKWLELLWGDRCCSQTMWMTDVASKSPLHAVR